MSVAVLGDGVFRDLFAPAKGKSEWGMDTLTRRMSGARSGLDSFLATLAQGQGLTGFPGYYLQTWEPDENPDVASVTLNYKGLVTGGTPIPDAQTEVTRSSGSISKNYSSENLGLGRVYKRTPVYFSVPQAVPPPTLPNSPPIAYIEIYATGATFEFIYDAIQTTYRYINVGQPSRPRFFVVNIPRIPKVIRARLLTADGTVYGGIAPTFPFGDITPVVVNRIVGFVAKNVIGSPYYECQDVVRREIGEGESDTAENYGE